MLHAEVLEDAADVRPLSTSGKGGGSCLLTDQELLGLPGVWASLVSPPEISGTHREQYPI